jgi:hypothetical protein
MTAFGWFLDRGVAQDSNQIDADSLALPRLRIDTDFERNRLADGDFVALSQSRNVKENISAAIVRLDESKALVFVEHLNFAAWHAVPTLSMISI